jgi:hypothetical protein
MIENSLVAAPLTGSAQAAGADAPPRSRRCQPVGSVQAAEVIPAEAAGPADAGGDPHAAVAAGAPDAEEQASVAALAAAVTSSGTANTNDIPTSDVAATAR